ncbi:MAG: fsr 2 [Firmicutes bacterium]|nr:fsr 2 [Bacillota bacterium]
MSIQASKNESIYIWLLTAGHFLSDFYVSFLPALLPVVIASLGLSLTAGGILVMINSFTAILQPLFGYYIDKYGCTWLVLLTMPISAVFICLAGIAPTFWMLFICILMAGLGGSLFHPLGSSLMGKITTAESKGLSMSIFIGGGNVGVAIAPAIVIFLILTFGITSLLYLILPSVLLTLAYYFYGIHRIPLSSPPSSHFSPVPGPAWYKSANLLKLNIVMGLRSWPQVALPTFLPLWLAQQNHSPALAGGMLTVFLSGGALGSVIGGYVGDQTGRKNCIMGALFIGLIAIYLLLSNELGIITWIMLGISGAALQGALPSSIVWAQDMLPENAAMASGMMLGMSFGLGGLGAALTATLGDIIGLQPALLWTLFPLILAIPLTYIIPEYTLTAAQQKTEGL